MLSVELVITNAVLGNQVTPAEMVRALWLCEKENVRFNLGPAFRVFHSVIHQVAQKKPKKRSKKGPTTT